MRRLALLSALALAGCGGATATTQTVTVREHPPTVTRVAFIERADAVCERFIERFAPAAARLYEMEPVPPGMSQQVKEVYARGVLDAYREEAEAFNWLVQRLYRLSPPSGDKATVDAFIEANARMRDGYEQAIQAAGTGDVESADINLGYTTDAAHDVKRIARRYGFQVCGGA